MSKQNDITWLANYYFRSQGYCNKKIKGVKHYGRSTKAQRKKSKPIHTIWLYKVLGHKKAAEDFKCSEASCKSWRYGYRQPSIAQAKQIIQATEGRLDFESIYGSISEILETKN
jgi:hypothetical protein